MKCELIKAASVGEKSRVPERAVAVILGWFGATQRRLRHHAKLFSDQVGVDTIVAIPPMISVAFPTAASLFFTSSLERVLSGRSKIFFLAMSGNGQNALSHFLISASNEALVANISGIAFDSAPVVRSADVWSKAFTAAAFGLSPFHKKGDSPVYERPIITSTAKAIIQTHLKLPWNVSHSRKLEGSFSKLPKGAKCPMLFLYSDSDPLVDCVNVENFAESQSMERPVSLLKFKESGHVNHLRCYPNEYSSSLVTFARKCLSDE